MVLSNMFNPPVFIFFIDCFKALPFCGSFLSFVFVLSLPCNPLVTCWERADLLAFLYVMFLVFLSLSICRPGLGMVIDCIDS